MRNTWRKWASPVALVLLLALLGFGLWWGWQELTKPVQPTLAPPCVVQSASVLTADQVRVKVYNAGTALGRAGQVTEQLRNKGFDTLQPANSSTQVNTTTIVGRAIDDPAVALVAGFFPESELRGDERTDGTIDVIVGDNFPGFNDQAPTEVGVPGGTVCLPGETPSEEPAGIEGAELPDSEPA